MGHEHRPHARRGGSAVLGHPRTHPPDRGQGVEEVEAPLAVAQAAELLRQLNSNSRAAISACARFAAAWLLQDGSDIEALAPNMGGLKDECNVQISGLLRIPARCVLRIVELEEPKLALTFSSTDPSSHLALGQTRQES